MRLNLKRFSLCSLIVIIFLSGCAYQEASIKNSPQAKEELRQLLQKPYIDTFDIAYNFRMNLFEQKLIDITFRQIKKGEQQRQDAYGNMLGFNLSVSSFVSDGQKVTCAKFDNEWKCSYGDKVCRKISKGEECQSTSQEGIPPTIKPALLEKAEVAYAGNKQLIGVDVKCYILTGTENGRKTSIEICLDDNGLIFSMSTKAKGFQATIEAKSFSTNVKQDDFTLPAIIS